MKIILSIILTCSLAPAFAQSRHDVAERHIKSVTIRNEEVRKKGLRVETTFQRYDKDGNVTERIEYGADSTINQWERTQYNTKGDEILSEKLDSAGNVIRKTVTEYNGQAQEIRRIVYDRTGEVREQEITEYNNFGDKIRSTVVDKTGALKEKTEYEYDNKAMLKARRRYNAEGALIETRSYTYEY